MVLLVIRVFPGEFRGISQLSLPSMPPVLGTEWKHNVVVGDDLRNRHWEYVD